MNNGIRIKLQDLKKLVKKLEARSEELKSLIESASIEDTLIVKLMASRHQQATYGIFENLEDSANTHAQEIFE